MLISFTVVPTAVCFLSRIHYRCWLTQKWHETVYYSIGLTFHDTESKPYYIYGAGVAGLGYCKYYVWCFIICLKILKGDVWCIQQLRRSWVRGGNRPRGVRFPPTPPRKMDWSQCRAVSYQLKLRVSFGTSHGIALKPTSTIGLIICISVIFTPRALRS